MEDFDFDLDGFDIHENRNPKVLDPGDVGVRSSRSMTNAIVTHIIFTPESAKKFGIEEGHRIQVRENHGSNKLILVNYGLVKDKRFGYKVTKSKKSHQFRVAVTDILKDEYGTERVPCVFGSVHSGRHKAANIDLSGLVIE